jgi:adenosylcobyric acid synthase
MTARAVMVLGTTSGAGKSWLATALCRWYARQGLKVAPFKAQNMSNNARVALGLAGRPGEIGAAQYFQALAAGRTPEVRMNPVLLKPEADTQSQVVLLGEVDAALSRMPWIERSARLWLPAREALQALMAENDVVVIEGAGSPAEINLAASDYVNLETARAAQAACLLVTDIDRGGAFAHLYGTHQLMPPDVRSLLRGFVLNKFRGDAALLAPGPQQLERLTGVPTLGVLPMWREHGLPEEDGVFHEAPTGDGLVIAVVAYPRVSNLDEFQPLRRLPGVRLLWARSAAELAGADWIILPGSKSVGADLRWLRAQQIDATLARHAGAGRLVLGICGGLQMLGEALVDPEGVDGFDGNAPGLGLLPLVTAFERDKLLRHDAVRFERLDSPWHALSGLRAQAYEIRHGRTRAHPSMAPPQVALRNAEGEPIGWQQGSVLGVYAHGLFEEAEVARALFGRSRAPLDTVFEGLADFVEQHLGRPALERLIAG